jgi:adenine-specific DNA-methyltransferase
MADGRNKKAGQGRKTPGRQKILTTLRHDEAKRKNIPTAEQQSTAEWLEEKRPKPPVHYPDAQLVWRGKDRQDWSDLVVQTPPLYIQEKIHPKAIIDDLKRPTRRREARADAPDLFADFNGLVAGSARRVLPARPALVEPHDPGRLLQVMASLAERESLKGKVQCIYFDPPYGIKFNSNWQVSTQSRDVKDGKQPTFRASPSR